MFKDTSIFQGVREFATPKGDVRAIEQGVGESIYLKIGQSFYYQFGVTKKCSIRSIYNRLQSAYTGD